MEARKPDEVGKVGEEAIGPLSLPRPEASPLGCLLLALLMLGAYFGAYWLASVFVQHFGWGERRGREVAWFALLIIFTAVARVARQLRERFQPRLRIVRGSGESLDPPVVMIDVWTADSLGVRAIPAVSSFLLAVLMVWMALLPVMSSVEVSGHLALFYSVFYFFNHCAKCFIP